MDLFNNIDLTQKAMEATLLRQTVISENIANVDTPNYKRKDVEFESLLQRELSRRGNTSTLTSIEPEVYVTSPNTSYRLDGNNIDIEVEMAEEAKVSAKYDALVTRLNAQLKRFTQTLQSIK